MAGCIEESTREKGGDLHKTFDETIAVDMILGSDEKNQIVINRSTLCNEP